jgi:hypothetical protein
VFWDAGEGCVSDRERPQGCNLLLSRMERARRATFKKEFGNEVPPREKIVGAEKN